MTVVLKNGAEYPTHVWAVLCRASVRLQLEGDEIGKVMFGEPYEDEVLVGELSAIAKRSSDNSKRLAQDVLNALTESVEPVVPNPE